jgi:hypothetical protein
MPEAANKTRQTRAALIRRLIGHAAAVWIAKDRTFEGKI